MTQPPHDDAAEMAVLGSLLVAENALDAVSDRLLPEHFYSETRGDLYALMLSMVQDGQHVDVVTVARRVREMGLRWDALELANLAAEVTTPQAVVTYADAVIQDAHRRRVIRLAQDVENRAEVNEDPGEPVADLLDEMTYQGGGARTGADVAMSAMEHAEHLAQPEAVRRVVPSGFPSMDRMIHGLQAGRFIVVASRPGIGKSTLVANMLVSVAKHGRAVGLFSLEMDAEEVGLRMLCAEGDVVHDHVQQGIMTRDAWQHMTAAAETLGALPLHVNDQTDITPVQMRSWVRRMRGLDLAVVAVDYVQLMQPARRGESRQQEVAEMSRQMKKLAREAGVCVIGVAQLNRAIENRKDKTPQLSDLRETGALEADADQVVMLWRDDSEEDTNLVLGSVAKNRIGMTGQFSLSFQGGHFRFVDRLAGPRIGR